MPSKKATGLAVVLAATIALLIVVGLPGPAWLAVVLAAVALVELVALVVTLRDGRA